MQMPRRYSFKNYQTISCYDTARPTTHSGYSFLLHTKNFVRSNTYTFIS